jgi:GNAT superfamily N-acetyltransferase
MGVAIKPLTGHQIAIAVADLASLRITVFADWPYLYDGDLAYEEDYLREFAEAQDAVLVLARDGERAVGAATASPMMAQKPEFRAPFEERGLDCSSLFYFGESVLLASYRGQGIGHAFFDHREAQARACGAKAACFAAVSALTTIQTGPPVTSRSMHSGANADMRRSRASSPNCRGRTIVKRRKVQNRCSTG